MIITKAELENAIKVIMHSALNFEEGLEGGIMITISQPDETPEISYYRGGRFVAGARWNMVEPSEEIGLMATNILSLTPTKLYARSR